MLYHQYFSALLDQEVNAEKNKFMLLYNRQNVAQDHGITDCLKI
jgi:hypothetical protein